MTAKLKDLIAKFYAVAGLFHDIGKFAERAEQVETDPDKVFQEYRYAHAYRTELALVDLFGERVSQHPQELDELTALNLAARHHKPRNNFELIVAEADRIAAGHERMEADGASDFEPSAGEIKSRIPLVSILSRIWIDNGYQEKGSPVSDWRYKLRPLSWAFIPEKMEEIFPCQAETYAPETVSKDYKKLWESFRKSLKLNPRGKQLDIFENFETIYEVCRELMWSIPESTQRKTLQDVSLFEHSRLTAAISCCLYIYHADDKGMIADSASEQSLIRDRSVNKFLLFCGDISGIQRFVYQISSKGAYRTLKGRSFFIQLLTEILARNFASEFGLSLPNILYASGGKFYVLLPSTHGVAEKLIDLSEKLNEWLFHEFGGDLYVRTGFKVLCADDLTRQTGRTLYDVWEEVTRELFLADRKKYQAMAVSQYDILFGTDRHETDACEVCHTSMTGGKRCATCTKMEDIGAALRNSRYVALSEKEIAIQHRKCLFELSGVFLKDTYVWLLNADEMPVSVTVPISFLALNESGFSAVPFKFSRPEIVNSGLLILGSNLSFDKTFDEIADESKGIKRLGILRMDVDNLGKIFSQGLRYYRHGKQAGKGFYSLGRITTLSSQLSLFFGAIVPQIIRSDPCSAERVAVVYSGGDDLFLLGSWDVIPDVAFRIRQKFGQFACHNTCFSLSAGIVLTGGKFPIYKGAEMAGEAEERAKANQYRSKDGRICTKNSLTFLDMVIAWPEFEELQQMYHQLLKILKKKRSYPLLRRLMDIAQSWEKDKATFGGRKVLTLKEVRGKLMAEQWRWRMVYALSRFCEDRPDLQRNVQEIQLFAVGNMNSTNRRGIELLGLLSRWLELSVRDELREEE